MTQCQCSMRIRLVGDGCRCCQPQEYIDRLLDNAKEDQAELDKATARVAELEAAVEKAKALVISANRDFGPSVDLDDAEELLAAALLSGKERS